MVCTTNTVPTTSGPSDPVGEARLNSLSIEATKNEVFWEVNVENLSESDNEVRVAYEIYGGNGDLSNSGSQQVIVPGLGVRTLSGSLFHNLAPGDTLDFIATVEDTDNSASRSLTVPEEGTTASGGGIFAIFKQKPLLTAGAIGIAGYAFMRSRNGR